MTLEELQEAIFRSLLQVQGLRPPATQHALGTTEQVEAPESVRRTRELAERLINDAYQNGFTQPPEFSFETTQLLGGAVAQYVGHAASTTHFAFKADKSPDLLKQAHALRLLRDGQMVPENCQKLFPKVYSLLPDGPPFAYLMEFFGSGYTRLSDYLFRDAGTTPAEVVIGQVLDNVFNLFENRHDVLLPDPMAVYVDRVRARLAKAARPDSKLQKIAASNRLIINSEEYGPYGTYLDAVIPKISSFQPPFSCVVHGDLHPGNVFFKDDGGTLQIRLIDPKPWIWGDYMFDIGKLLHYTMVTGPREDSNSVQISVFENETPPRVEYDIRRTDRAEKAIEITSSRLQEFATTNHDANYQKRLSLSLASNLLGLTENRLNRDRPLEDEAILYYCEGLRHLKQAAEGLWENG